MFRTTEITIDTGSLNYGISLNVLFTQLARACQHEGAAGEMKLYMHHDGSVTTDDGRLIFSPQKKSQIQQPLAKKG
jgi:hypothetical protein